MTTLSRPLGGLLGGGIVESILGADASSGPAAGYTLRLESDLGVISSGGVVSEWDSNGGASIKATSPSGSQPTLVAGVINGYPVIRFNGTSSYMQLSSVLDYLTSTVFVVAKHNNTSLGMITGYSGGNIQFRYSSGTAQSTAGVGYSLGSASVTGNNQVNHILTLKAGGGSAVLKLNGSPGSTVSVTDSSFLQDQIGVYQTSQFFLAADYAALLYYPSQLSAADEATTLAYLNNKYRIF